MSNFHRERQRIPTGSSPEEQGEERTGAWSPHLDAGYNIYKSLAKSSRRKSLCQHHSSKKYLPFTFGMFSLCLDMGIIHRLFSFLCLPILYGTSISAYYLYTYMFYQVTIHTYIYKDFVHIYNSVLNPSINVMPQLCDSGCYFKFPDILKVSAHVSHLEGMWSLLWLRKWTVRCKANKSNLEAFYEHSILAMYSFCFL